MPTTAQVLEVLLAVGPAASWPSQKRDNVTDTGKPVPGMCIGLVFALGGLGAKASQVSEMYPRLATFLVTWTAASLPKTRDGNNFPFSSLQVRAYVRGCVVCARVCVCVGFACVLIHFVISLTQVLSTPMERACLSR